MYSNDDADVSQAYVQWVGDAVPSTHKAKATMAYSSLQALVQAVLPVSGAFAASMTLVCILSEFTAESASGLR